MKAKPAVPALNIVKWIVTWSLAAIGLAATALAQSAPAPAGGFKIDEARLGSWDNSLTNRPFFLAPAFSPQGGAVSSAVGLGILLLDFAAAMSQPAYALSGDGRHFAYASARKCEGMSKVCIVLDGQVEAAPGGVGSGSLALSRDGKRVAYATRKGKQWVVSVDGREGAEYDGIAVGSVSFSPDGKRVAYAALLGRQWSVVVDGQAGAAYGGIGNNYPVFSPDSQRVAYPAQTDGKWVAVVDGHADEACDRVWGLTSAPMANVSRMGHSGASSGRWWWMDMRARSTRTSPG
jgi:hypothetical protein